MKKDLFIDIANIILSFVAIFCLSVAFLPYYGAYAKAVKKERPYDIIFEAP